MQTIRRLYFYLVTIISVEVILWGVISLLRDVFSRGVYSSSAGMISQALALILVGVPIFLLHWGWAQRATTRDEEENASPLRALFLYGILLGTLIPVAQNMLALINRLLLQVAGLSLGYAIVGSNQSLPDNLIALGMNGVAALYFFRVLRENWNSLASPDDFADIRRIYRYIWLLYGLLMTIFGVQQTLRFLFYIPSGVLGMVGRDLFINGVSLALVGTPIWLLMWQTCQDALSEPSEQVAWLRKLVLYLLSLGGVITVLTTSGIVADIILRWLLGQSMALVDFMQAISGPVSIGLPLAAVWAYYGRWLHSDIAAVPDESRRAGLKRLYHYILSFIGWVTTFIGLALLISFLIDLLVGSPGLFTETRRTELSGALAVLLVSMPLWLLNWRPVQAEALRDDPAGDQARRSVVRKAYLYLVIFGCVIGGMVAAVNLANRLFDLLLTGNKATDFPADLLNFFQLLVLFSLFLYYHFSVQRRDGSQVADARVEQQELFPVLVFDAEETLFAQAFVAAMAKVSKTMPVAVQSGGQPLPDDASQIKAIVLPSSLALEPNEALRLWLKDFAGHKLVIPSPASGWYWPGGAGKHEFSQAARILRTLAEGQEVRPASATPGWMIVVYISAALFWAETLFFLLMLGISLVFSG